MSTGLVTAISARILVEQCKSLGFDQTMLLNHAGLSDQAINNPSSYIAIEKMNLLWDSILHFTHDQMFALHAVERVPFGAYRVLDYMLALSSSPKDALMRSGRAFALVNSAFTLSLRLSRDLAYLELHALKKDQNVARAHIEYVLGNYLTRLRIAANIPCKPLEVHFTFKRPALATDYHRFFGCRIRFNQGLNRMVFLRELMEVPLPHADPALCEVLEGYAQQRLRNATYKSPTFDDIQDAVSQNLEAKNLSLGFIARLCGRSDRSLQREIHAHGMSYRELLDMARRDRALNLLHQQNLPIKEIATKLNFSDTSSFSRAFRRWTGKWPLQSRRERN